MEHLSELLCKLVVENRELIDRAKPDDIHISKSFFLLPVWFMRLHFNQNFSFATISFSISSSLKRASGMSPGVRSTWSSAMLVNLNLPQGPLNLACETIRFSSLLAAGEVSRGGTSATQRQKFHTDDANQCLRNKSSSHGSLNINLSNFTCLLVDFGKVRCSSANELQQNSNASSRADYIPQILTVLLEIFRVYICPLWPFVVFCLSFVNNS